jgi:hypothetical protein
MRPREKPKHRSAQQYPFTHARRGLRWDPIPRPPDPRVVEELSGFRVAGAQPLCPIPCRFRRLDRRNSPLSGESEISKVLLWARRNVRSVVLQCVAEVCVRAIHDRGAVTICIHEPPRRGLDQLETRVFSGSTSRRRSGAPGWISARNHLDGFHETKLSRARFRVKLSVRGVGQASKVHRFPTNPPSC